MRIILSNDDGINSHYLHALYAALIAAGHDVRVIAPSMQHSGSGCCLTVHPPILTHAISMETTYGRIEGLSVDGTPADCVILALDCLYTDFNPELVISGPNLGPNAGFDVFYSGTVGAAIQGVMYGYHSLAVSHCGKTGFDLEYAEKVIRFIDRMEWKKLPKEYVYNLNLPGCKPNEIKGLKVCGHSTDWEFIELYEKRLSPKGDPYFWSKNPFMHFMLESEGTDKSWLHKGWATLTPLRINLNDQNLIDELSKKTLWD